MENQKKIQPSSSNLRIIEKPDSVSWDDIQDCLNKAHAQNRQNGISMTHYLRSASWISDYIGAEGKCWVAMDGNKVVGVACIKVKHGAKYYNAGPSGYCCFAGVLPEYRGSGVYKKLAQIRESYARDHSFITIYADTHIRNKRLITIALKNGYSKVSLRQYGDHFSVVMAKWLGPCPYSKFFLRKSYLRASIRLRRKYLVNLIMGNGAK